MACVRERARRIGEGRVKCHILLVQKRPSPVQNGLCERGGEREGEGEGKCHWLSRKGLALFKMACVRERESGRGKGRDKHKVSSSNTFETCSRGFEAL